MVWIIIGVVLLVAFGPVLWLLPSKRDRRLAAMRSEAARSGLVVELARLPKLNPSADERVSAGGRIKTPVVDCTAYRLMLGEALNFLPGWRAQRGAEDALAVDQWQAPWSYELDKRPAADARSEAEATATELAPLVERLPGDVIGLELTPRTLTAYWLESHASGTADVRTLSELLREMEASLTTLNGRLEAAAKAGSEDPD